MMNKFLAIVILSAGKGSRMASPRPKVLHSLAGLSLAQHVTNLAVSLNPQKILALVPPPPEPSIEETLEQSLNGRPIIGHYAEMDEIAKAFSPYETYVQHEPKGTGHAAMLALQHLADNPTFAKDIFSDSAVLLFLYGDTALLTKPTIDHMLQKIAQGADLVTLGFYAKTHYPYGRLLVKGQVLENIIEAKDYVLQQSATNPYASPKHQVHQQMENQAELFNSGVMAVKTKILGKKLGHYLQQLTPNNQAGEYYLTELVSLLHAAGAHLTYVVGSESECLGVNTQQDLAVAESVMQQRLRQHWLSRGVTLLNPDSVFFSYDTKIGKGSVIEPFVIIGTGVEIGQQVTVKGFSHIAGASIGDHASIGPFARIRKGAVLSSHVQVGNFVEIKNSYLASGVKANHLSYLGDAEIGAAANIGAGTITCNYDGMKKSQTIIGRGAFIGSNSALVAPLTIGDGAVIGAGSTITTNVAADALALARPEQTTIAGYRQKKWKNKK